jgi:hypothetical protein
MAALGPAGIELQKAVEASKTAKTKEEKDAAELQMNRAKAAVNERMKSEEFLNAVMVAGGRVGPAMQKMYEENKLKAGTTFTENKTGQTTGQAIATNQGAAVNQQQGRDEKGAKDEGAKTTELYIQVMNRSKDVTAMVASGANKMNDALVKIPETAKLIDGALAATKSRVKNDKGEEIPMAQGGVQGLLDRAKAAGLSGGDEGKTGPTGPTGQKIPGPVGPGKNPLDIIQEKLTATIMNWANEGRGTVDIVKFLGGTDLKAFTGGSTPQGGRADGSKSSTGSWFEDFGTEKIMALHKKEAIVPEGKVGEFMQDMMKTANISNINPKDESANKTTMTMEEMDSMMKSMKSMSPESLLQFASKGNEQQAEMAKKIYGEMDLAAKQASSEAKLQKTESAKTTATPKDNPITELQKKLVEAGAKIKVDGQMGPETMTAIKANMANMVKETAKKPETSTPAASADTGSKSNEKTAPAVGDATLSDVVKSLESLNMLMGQLTSHAAETAEHSGNAVKATKGLNGNLFAR